MPVMAHRTDGWQEGETVVGWVFLFGLVLFSRHHLHIAAIDEPACTLRSREHGGLLRTWSHDIVVTPIDAPQCEYRDRIEIDAGLFAPLVGLCVRWVYRMRQRRWRALARELERTVGRTTTFGIESRRTSSSPRTGMSSAGGDPAAQEHHREWGERDR